MSFSYIDLSTAAAHGALFFLVVLCVTSVKLVGPPSGAATDAPSEASRRGAFYCYPSEDWEEKQASMK